MQACVVRKTVHNPRPMQPPIIALESRDVFVHIIGAPIAGFQDNSKLGQIDFDLPCRIIDGVTRMSTCPDLQGVDASMSMFHNCVAAGEVAVGFFRSRGKGIKQSFPFVVNGKKTTVTPRDVPLVGPTSLFIDAPTEAQLRLLYWWAAALSVSNAHCSLFIGGLPTDEPAIRKNVHAFEAVVKHPGGLKRGRDDDTEDGEVVSDSDDSSATLKQLHHRVMTAQARLEQAKQTLDECIGESEAFDAAADAYIKCRKDVKQCMDALRAVL
jgi:hypothetical protein